MRLLILDFLRRWWLVLAAYFVICAGVAAGGQPGSFPPALLVCLIFDAQRGLFRTVRPLPVTRGTQAAAWWIIGVPLVPIFTVFALGCGLLIHVSIKSPTVDPWFVLAVQTWVGLGYAGLCFLFALGLPTRPPTSVLDHITQIFFGGMWGLSMSGMMWLMPFLPKTVAGIHTWHWIIIGVSPLFFVFSIVGAPGLLRRRMFAVAAGTQPSPRSGAHSVESTGGLTGVPLFFAHIIGRFAMMLVAMALVTQVVSNLISKPHSQARTLGKQLIGFDSVSGIPAMQIVFFAVGMGAVCAEALNIRALRCLPLSTTRLALLLSGAPLALGLSGAVTIALLFPEGAAGVGRLAFAGLFAIGMVGISLLLQSIYLHISSGWRFGVVGAVCFPSIFGFFGMFVAPYWAAPAGALCGIAGYALLYRGLKNSPAFYAPRRVFGMNIAEPLAVR